MINKIIILLVIFMFFTTETYTQVLGFFKAKSGLETAFSLANQNVVDAKLVNIITGNMSFNIGFGYIEGEYKYSGDSIGMANFWLYTFTTEGDPTNSYQVFVAYVLMTETFVSHNIPLDFTDFGVEFAYDKYIDTATMLNSDVFTTGLASNELFTTSQNIINNETGEFNVIAIGSVKNAFSCLEKDKIYWMRYIGHNQHQICCKTDFDNVDNLSCYDYESILDDYSQSNINIFPSPAKDIINIDNPYEESITSISIYDINGNELFNCNSNKTNINISTFAAGNYYICFNLKNKKIFRSFVVNE